MAHESVDSLMRTIESLLTSNSPMQSLSCDHREEFCVLHEKVSSLEVFLKKFEKNNVSREMTDLEVVANIVEQTIQLGVTEAVFANDENLREKAQERLFDSLQQGGEDMDRIWKESTKIQDKRNVMNFQWFKIFQCFMIFQWFNKTSKKYTNVKKIIVGRDDQRERLLNEQTTGYSGEPKVIPIVGMGGIEYLSLRMSFMDQDESWNLFKSTAFSNEALPSEFETIGKQIAEKCHGLPLTIVVVAGLLKSKRAIEYWKSVAKVVTSFVTNDPDKQCSRVLGLSYYHLTSDLVTTQIGALAVTKDSGIPAKNLMRSWFAEGFLNLENDLEGEAKYLKELVDRCLVLVCKKIIDGTKVRSCKIQNVNLSVCIKCSPLSVTCDETDYCYYGLYRAILTPVHRQLRDHDNNDLLKRTHSIFAFTLNNSIYVLKLEHIHFKFLKVLKLRDIVIVSFPVQILNLIWSRYLSLLSRQNLDIPPEICRLWNLQTFIVQGPGPSVEITFPEEILGLMQLRHLKLVLKLVELRNTHEVSETFPKFIMSAPVSPNPGKALLTDRNGGGSLKAGLRKFKFLKALSFRRHKKAYHAEEGSSSDGKNSVRSEDPDYVYPVDTDSLDEDLEGESEEGKEDTSVQKSFNYEALVYANHAGGSFCSNTSGSSSDEDLVHYSHHISDTRHKYPEDTTAANQSAKQSSKRSLLSWRKRKLSFKSPKTKGEPLLKKHYGEDGGDDIEFDRRQLCSSDESSSRGHKSEETSPISVSEFGDESFVVGSWEQK
ncbi:hypothetical protein CQW23_34144 [Capsicum baccatum]|uniref:Uncharacterized protein n=1 Tax=Capsicum baccatum TaxID=33114 RepID=A0A2G2UZP2_CAPBA|nr:hypothetical protein CQW23_34144 [Capsicum baccatum]